MAFQVLGGLAGVARGRTWRGRFVCLWLLVRGQGGCGKSERDRRALLRSISGRIIYEENMYGHVAALFLNEPFYLVEVIAH